MLNEFRFQTGSIKRTLSLTSRWMQQVLNSFDSKLVRLKGNYRYTSNIDCEVSIPNWFD